MNVADSNNDVSGDLDLDKIFSFQLDGFQLKACEALNQGHSVVVSAPTGSGKTLIGEYAIYRAISHCKKVFYTTPLKALSNQKLRDFRDQFGEENVGLMTGDLSLNRKASIVVMTTEIFRNMLYASFESREDPLADVETVVLDECHYMNDSQRGTVWEESIIHCPSSVQLVALSATVANAGQLTDWIQRVHGPTQLIISEFRPVPLEFTFCSAKGLHPLLNEKGTGLHPNCKVWRSPKGHKRKGRLQKPPQPQSPQIGFVVSEMAKRNMLPAIYFIFSRRGCDKAVREIGHLTLLDLKQQKQVKERLEEFIYLNPEAVREGIHSEALIRGIAAHHAGVLPAWKELIESLFQQGLIKVVFATETLAAGINMPARSTVISALSKRTESGHRLLMGSEFLQMAGRAGRRGLDSQGYVVTVQNRFEGVKEAGQLAISKAEPLVSQFTPSYGMALNLLNCYQLHKAREIIERSFGRYLSTLDLVEDEDFLEERRSQLKDLKIIAGEVPWQDFEVYEKERSRLKEERRLFRILKQQAAETLSNELTLALQFASLGSLVSLKSPQVKGTVTPAVIVDKLPGSGQFPLLLCLTIENIWILQPCNAVVSLYADLSCLEIKNIQKPNLIKSGEVRIGNENSLTLANELIPISRSHDLKTPQYDLAKEVIAQAKLVSELEKRLETLPAHRWGERKKLKKHRRRMEDLELEIKEHERLLHYRANHHWEMFLSLVDILDHFGCLEELKPTQLGRSVASIRGENELWLGLVFMSGYLDDLHSADLAAVVMAISTEVNRPDLWCGYPLPKCAEEALHDLSSLRKELLRIQRLSNIVIPVCFELELIGIVYAWAKGVLWRDLIANTSLDEGDVVRVIRRTLDVLSQIPHCESISEKLRKNARLACSSINRFPVCEAEDILKAEDNMNPATQRLL